MSNIKIGFKNLQDKVLPQLKQQLADTKGLFKGKERKALETKIKETAVMALPIAAVYIIIY